LLFSRSEIVIPAISLIDENNGARTESLGKYHARQGEPRSEIRKCSSQLLDITLHPFNGGREPKPVLDEIGIEMVTKYIAIAFVEYFCNHPPKSCLNWFRRHTYLFGFATILSLQPDQIFINA
jgi:hypothetical protein